MCRFKNVPEEYEVINVDRSDFSDTDILANKLAGCSVVLHLAGVNRASPNEIETINPELSRALSQALTVSGTQAHVIYANSTQQCTDTPYGRGKSHAADILSKWAGKSGADFTNIVLPHIFGETGRPYYNTVTATLCDQLVKGIKPTINEGAQVELLHAGDAADQMLDQLGQEGTRTVRLQGKAISVQALYDTLQAFKSGYDNLQFPEFCDKFTVQLFNTYRCAEFPESYPRPLKMNSDQRGVLFEAVKGGGGGQTFLSWTKPGVERGNHFHRLKVERFLVLSGEAEIRVRKLFDSKVHRFHVNGDTPVVVDMPTLHTHSIVNTGAGPLLTLFWANEVFNPKNPDTYHETVLLENTNT